MIRILALLLAMPAQAAAHEFYAWECCSDKDCFPLAAGAVTAQSDGWRIEATGETVRYGDKKIKVAPDGQFHGCFRFGDPKAELLCLYVPPQGF